MKNIYYRLIISDVMAWDTCHITGTYCQHVINRNQSKSINIGSFSLLPVFCFILYRIFHTSFLQSSNSMCILDSEEKIVFSQSETSIDHGSHVFC